MSGDVSLALTAGTRLGPYEIVAPLAQGGMGEVYKARDTRLDRTVAIKVLPAEWGLSDEMKERFDREARLIASLNHPNICKIHDVGQVPAPGPDRVPIDFLVMEHLDGETLTDRLTRGPIPVAEAVTIGLAISDALDTAHRQGVIHRDLKPGNVMLTPGGPKLLDFGLAKLHPVPGALQGGTPTPAGGRVPTPITRAGAIPGTLQYMAPEQLDGVEADARTDIFAFGVVMHEMITGRRAFEGKSQVLLISAIATADPPPLSRVQPTVPPALDHVVSMCLAKDPDDRWQTARDLRAELQWVAEGGSVTQLVAEAASARPSRWRVTRLLLAGAAVLIALLAVPALTYFRGAARPERLEIRVSTAPLVYGGNPAQHGFFAISPDGRELVVRADPPGPDPAALYVGSLDFQTPRRLAGTEDAFQPFWSADGSSIGFVANGRLQRIDAAGGRPQQVCSAPDFRGGAWNRQGVILFGSTSGLFSVPAQGGQPSAVTTVEGSQAGHFWPSFLPDGRRFLFLVYSPQSSDREIVAGSLDSKERTRITGAPASAVYSSGHLIFWRDRSLYAQPLDADELRLEGEATRLADAVPHNPNSGHAGFGVSESGAVAFYRDTTVDTAVGSEALEWQLSWVDRAGRNPQYLGKPGVYRGAEISPNGQRIAVHRHDAKGGDVLVLEPNGTETKISFDASQENSNPVWSHDGLRITYASRRNGKWGLYEAASDGSGSEKLLVESELPKVPLAWSPDGALLLYWVRDLRTAGDLWILHANDKKVQQVVATPADERHGQISGDGKWIAFSSSTGGGRREVFVQPFPSGSGRWQVSPDANAGGDWPRWSPKTNELLYHSLGSGVGQGATAPSNNLVILGPLFSARWKTVGSTFTPERPHEVVRVYAVDLPHEGGDYHTFGVSPDGQRFLTFLLVGFASTGASVATEVGPDPAAGLTVLMNWK